MTVWVQERRYLISVVPAKAGTHNHREACGEERRSVRAPTRT